MSKYKFYAVKVGRVPGIYNAWKECEKQIIRFKNQKYKGFNVLEEAKKFMKDEESIMITDTSTLDNFSDPKLPQGDSKHFDIFTDGSYEAGVYSWAFAAYRGVKLVHTASARGTNKRALLSNNVAGELEAVINAVRWAEDQGASSVTILHDYIGAAAWAYGTWKANKKLTQDYVEFIRPRLGWVQFNKVTAHSGIKGNELVDKLAKEALKLVSVKPAPHSNKKPSDVR